MQSHGQAAHRTSPVRACAHRITVVTIILARPVVAVAVEVRRPLMETARWTRAPLRPHRRRRNKRLRLPPTRAASSRSRLSPTPPPADAWTWRTAAGWTARRFSRTTASPTSTRPGCTASTARCTTPRPPSAWTCGMPPRPQAPPSTAIIATARRRRCGPSHS